MAKHYYTDFHPETVEVLQARHSQNKKKVFLFTEKLLNEMQYNKFYTYDFLNGVRIVSFRAYVQDWVVTYYLTDLHSLFKPEDIQNTIGELADWQPEDSNLLDDDDIEDEDDEEAVETLMSEIDLSKLEGNAKTKFEKLRNAIECLRFEEISQDEETEIIDNMFFMIYYEYEYNTN